jgi:hypothetical protein
MSFIEDVADDARLANQLKPIQDLRSSKRAVRAEVSRSFLLTEVAPGITNQEYSCALDMKGWVPQIFKNTVATPKQLNIVHIHQRYFQHLRPPSACDAEDGRVVGHMLMELAAGNPKDLAHVIRTFANRTAMLRECGFRHIGAMLVRLLRTEAQSGPDDDAPISALEPSSVTEKQAKAIGSAITSSVDRSLVPITALRNVVEAHAVLRAMRSGHVWFVPMLEVLTAHKAAIPIGSILMRSIGRQFQSNVTPDVRNFASSDADEVGEESSFSSVVRLGARSCLVLLWVYLLAFVWQVPTEVVDTALEETVEADLAASAVSLAVLDSSSSSSGLLNLRSVL